MKKSLSLREMKELPGTVTVATLVDPSDPQPRKRGGRRGSPRGKVTK